MTKEVENSRNIPEMSVGEFIVLVSSYYQSMPPHLAKPFMSIGPVGCGKTEGWQQIGERIERPTIMRHLSQIHPLDFGGVIADPIKRALLFAKSPLVQEVEDLLATGHKSALVVFDELDRVQAMALNACLQVLSERKQNGFHMGNVYIGAAGNGWHDVHTFELSKAALSRLNIVSVAPKVDEWLMWAASKQVDPRIIVTISQAPQVLNQHGDLPDTTWKLADPRAWMDLNNALKAGFDPYNSDCFIGKHAAVTFNQYINFSRDYSKEISAVLKGKKLNLTGKNSEAIMFGVYLAAAGQVKDVDLAYTYLQNADEEIGHEKAYISGRLITYNIPLEQLRAHKGIAKLHEDLYKSTI